MSREQKAIEIIDKLFWSCGQGIPKSKENIDIIVEALIDAYQEGIADALDGARS